MLGYNACEMTTSPLHYNLYVLGTSPLPLSVVPVELVIMAALFPAFLLLLALLVHLTEGFRQPGRFNTATPCHSRVTSFLPSQSLNRPRSLKISATQVDDIWTQPNIVSIKKDGEGLRTLDLEVGSDIAERYTDPGQYVKIKVGDSKPAFFAISSPPDKRNILSFLIKESPGNEAILNSKEGQQLDMSVPMGRGFQIEEYFNQYKNDFPTNSILLMACGSGLAPIAAAIESNKLGLKRTGYRTIFERRASLYIGARTPQHLPLRSKYAEWEELGVKVRFLKLPLFKKYR